MSNRHSPAGIPTRGAFSWLRFFAFTLALLLASPQGHAELFLTRNQNPFILFQGQPLPLPANPHQSHLQVSMDVANSLNLGFGSNESIYLDFESYYLNVRYIHTFSDRVSLLVDAPFIHRGGGFLDNAIDNWHEVFGLPRANRPQVSNDQFLIQYEQNGINVIRIDSMNAGAGDISLQLGYQLDRSADTELTLWAGLELPSGNSAELTGNDAVDASLTLALQQRSSDDVHLDLNLGMVFPGDDLMMQNPTNSSVLFAYAGGSWRALDWLKLKLQFETHGSYFRSDSLDMLNPATIIVFGGSIIIDKCNELDIGVSEDIKVGASPDVSFLFNWKTMQCD